MPARVRTRAVAGFTLLEMVVVLAIMGLVIGVAAVRVFTLVTSWRERTTLESIEQQFAHLPVLARQRGQDIVLPPPRPDAADAAASTPPEPPALRLPHDWMVHFSQPLRVRSSGLCEGTRIVVQHGARRYPRRVAPPFCAVVDDAASP